MDLDFTSEQEMLRDSAAKFFPNECPYGRVKELEESPEGYDPALWQKMVELGWMGIIFPEEYGGYEGAFLDLIIILEEMGKAAHPSTFFSTVVEGGLIILSGGTEEQKKDLLPQIAEGNLILSLAQYEEEGSYLASGIQMGAVEEGDQYLLNGKKMFAMDANVAHTLIAAARTGEEISLFLVDAGDPGITITKMPTIGKDNTCEVVFNGVYVSKNSLLGDAGTGWDVLKSVSSKIAVARCAEMVGGCKTCVDMTAAYAKEREQYGKPIGGYQIIQHYMANMLLAYDASYNYLYRVGGMVDAGMDFQAEASALKAYVNEAYKYISERAVQIHGGIGTTREADVGLFYRRAKSFEYLSGSTDHHYDRVASAILEKGVPKI